MTQSKREPFAVVEKFHDSKDYFVVAGGHTILPTQRKNDADYRAFMLNAAFNSRVDEEIELVRLKTIRMCADKADRMGSEEIRNAILFETLPTELEGK